MVRRAYIQRGPCQPRNHNFSQTKMLGVMRQFNPKWFYDYPNCVSSNATFYLMCYLFKDEDVHQHGRYIFFARGFRSWNKKDRFGIHVGGPNSDHYKVKKKRKDLMR
ncbi:hypothetical protein CDL12_03456 [Handroanthus impetiginosus]|uniref:Uncharacterized protein n=1 Tax=Handroanthus impetiginosus TaxID=429701 RepID=A0A2G9I235_9LAMI|nr:hypothetical protein CDL12_03456 [Handroanthus impetiginosus]